ncbi:glycine cleavage system aminomethyltransferase GcvT [Casimicrobium huifangae]|uniref:glycine cleavage system aminomethyltransferase GcvT n=1 Tax=Casimicrobium huifangae TaxID=2591109 RepID=UPI0037853101
MSEPVSEKLLRTPLYDLHVSLGARMVPFAGYDMPVQYLLGVLKEHLHTRAHAGLFDVSHMGQVELHGPDAAKALETLVPVDVLGIAAGKQRYALFTNEQGGILDDLMIFNTGSYLHVVVNAACKAQDIAHLQKHIGNRCDIRVRDDLALLALQGPGAEAALKGIAAGEVPQTFMAGGRLNLAGIDCLVTRSGYTGEDGFEISVPAAQCEALAKALLAQPNVQPIGLGARDSLRLEAGLCLYGHDLDTTTTPVEASLTWAMQKVRRTGGERAGGFPGAGVILGQLDDATKVKRKRVGLKPEGRAPIREGVELQDAAGNKIGVVTSGGFGPTVNAPVIMAYVDAAHAAVGRKINAMLRGTPTPVTVVAMPFAPHGYKR